MINITYTRYPTLLYASVTWKVSFALLSKSSKFPSIDNLAVYMSYFMFY